MRLQLIVLLATAGCVEAPAWFDDCDCGDDLCVEGADGTSCEAVPAECDRIFADSCDGSAKTTVACVEAICGEVSGDWSFDWDCHKGVGSVRRYADCSAVTALSSSSD